MDEDIRYRRRKRLAKTSQTGLVIALMVFGFVLLGIFRVGNANRVAGEPIFGGVPSAAGPAVSDGQRLYTEYCSGCHAPEGVGNPAAGIPPLDSTGDAWSKTRAELVSHILDGGKTMPELRGLVSEQDAATLLAFIQNWWTDEQRATFNANNP